MPQYLTSQELAERLGVKPQALYQWEDELRLPVPRDPTQQRKYDDDMVAVFEIVKDLRDEGNGFRTITRVIGGREPVKVGEEPPAPRPMAPVGETDPQADSLWQSRYVRASYVIERLEKAVHERDSRLEELEEELGRLRQSESQALAYLGDTAHELKAPLSAILGYSELLCMGRFGPISEQQEEILSLITRRAMDLGLLINELQGNAGQAELNFSCRPQVINPGPILAEAIMTVKAQAAARQQTIQSVIPGGLPPAHVDPTRLRQIVLNLLSNAIRYIQEGGKITVGIQVANPEFLAITISDNGPGIPAEELPRIFSRFYRLGREHHAEGTGLGLAIARKLAEKMGGKLWVESQVGRGSSFTFTIPQAMLGRSRLVP